MRVSWVFFFRFLTPFQWYLFHYYGLIWIILCIPWNTSLEKQAVIFSTIWGTWELLHFNFNLFSWLPFVIYVFWMRIYCSDSVWVLKWVYIFFSFTAHSSIKWSLLGLFKLVYFSSCKYFFEFLGFGKVHGGVKFFLANIFISSCFYKYWQVFFPKHLPGQRLSQLFLNWIQILLLW